MKANTKINYKKNSNLNRFLKGDCNMLYKKKIQMLTYISHFVGHKVTVSMQYKIKTIRLA